MQDKINFVIIVLFSFVATSIFGNARENIVNSATVVTLANQLGENRYIINYSRLQKHKENAELNEGVWGSRVHFGTMLHQEYNCETENSLITNQVINNLYKTVVNKAKQIDIIQSNEDTLVIETAVEVDYRMYLKMNSDVDAVLGYVNELFSSVNEIYIREVSAKIKIVNVRIWTDRSSPYGNDGTISQILSTFESQYEANMDTIKRDIAVMLTSFSFQQNGIAASIAGVCTSKAYCVCDLQMKVLEYPNYCWDVHVVAHEMGHVFGAIHTQSCYWPNGPLDSCIVSEGGDCVTIADIKPTQEGTIMSYCQQNSNAEVGLKFHPLQRVIIREYLESSECVGVKLPESYTSGIKGKLIYKQNNQPAAGVVLSITTVTNDLQFPGTPEPGGKTFVTTDVDGSFEFTHLAKGLYDITLPRNLVALPVVIDSWGSTVYVMVGSEPVTRDIYVQDVEKIEVTVSGNFKAENVALHVFSDKLVDGYARMIVPGFAFEQGFVAIPSLPDGKYSIVPQAEGHLFEPRKVSFTADSRGKGQKFKFTSKSDIWQANTTFVAYVTNDDSSQVAFVGNDTVSFFNSSNTQKVVVPADGIAIIDSDLYSGQYYILLDTDTTSWAISTVNGIGAHTKDLKAVHFTKRKRKFPLVAREYKLSVTRKDYNTIHNAEILLGKNTGFSVESKTVNLPFNFGIGNSSINQVTVFRNGYIILGAIDKNQHEVSSNLHSRADMILWALMPEGSNETRLEFDSLLEERGTISYSIVGNAPNRKAIFEWKNLRVAGYQSYRIDWFREQASDLNFMVIIGEDESVEYHYGYSPISPKTSNLALIGMRGADLLDYNVVQGGFKDPAEWFTREATTTFLDYVYINESPGIPEGLSFKWNTPLTGIDDTEQPFSTQLVVSPNPAINTVYVHNLPVGSTVRIVSMLGAEVASVRNTSTSAQLNTRELAAGMYTVQCSLNGKVVSKPLVIVR